VFRPGSHFLTSEKSPPSRTVCPRTVPLPSQELKMTYCNLTPRRSSFLKWISCCGAIVTILCLSSSANADILDLFGGGKSCGCNTSFQPACCQPTAEVPCQAAPVIESACCKSTCCPTEPQCCQPVCLSTCYTAPRLVCLCPPQKCCPPEIVVENCSCVPPLILPPPPCHKPVAPPTCHCKAEPCCTNGCGTIPTLVPEAMH